ncbi:MAG: hypothetical protein Q7T54_05600 [Candidatus Levybacteria bacterium]|nr:hypothetical protein [Candidatus Levybacteria bacterium]
MDNNQVVQPPSPASVQEAPIQQLSMQQVPPRSKKPIIVVAVIIVVILLIVFAAVFFVIPKNNSQISNIPTPTLVAPTLSATGAPISPSISAAIELTLEKGRQIDIPNSDVKILYVGADIPNPNCIDCSTTTDISLEQKGIEKKLQYLCGGIAGACTDKLVGFGFQIELVNANETSATVKILKQ